MDLAPSGYYLSYWYIQTLSLKSIGENVSRKNFIQEDTIPMLKRENMSGLVELYFKEN